MRNFLAFSFLILGFSLYSGSVSASNADACDAVFEPSLHGLCVAWHNANPKNQEKIAEKYARKSGGDTVPGSEPIPDLPPGDATCPCTADGDASSWDSPVSCFDLDGYHYVERFDVATGVLGTLTVTADFDEGRYSCTRDTTFGPFIEYASISEAEYNVCVTDIGDLSEGIPCD